MLRAVLCDFNGVLVDDEPLHLEALETVLAEEGVGLEPAAYWELYVGLEDRACLEAILRNAGRAAAGDRVMRLVARKARYYQDLVRSRGFRLFPGARDLVDTAVAAGLLLGVVSGALHEEVEQGLRQTGLAAAFKVVVTAADVRCGKPDPSIYRLGVRLLNEKPPLPVRLLHPHEVLAVEDSPRGLEAAAAAGLRTLGVAHTVAAARLTSADLVVPSLADLDLARLWRTRWPGGPG